MKFFMKILYVLVFIGLAFIFLDSGKTARDDKYIKEVILKNKGENTLENNKDEDFVANMFALNGLIYRKDIVATIEYNENVEVNNKATDVYVNLDVYQVTGLNTNPLVKTFYNVVVNEFSLDGDTSYNPTITGNYELPIYYENKTSSFTVKNKNFPLFGLSNVTSGEKVNVLNSAIFKYNDVEFFEIILAKSVNEEVTTKFDLKTFPNYPLESEQNKMYDDIFKILDTKGGGFKIPTKDQVELLNEQGYNYHLFEGQNAYDYLIYIYVGIYAVILILTTYFVYLKPYYNKKKTNR